MILEQLRLRNFCLFAGEQTFDLTPRRRGERHLPIVLFGGINGGGKTTLLDAIQLALYGQRARCSKRSSLPYDDFLRDCIHRGADEQLASVTLTFRYSSEGEENVYAVNRSWYAADGKIREELKVDKNGFPDAWLSENWPQLVEELFPLEVSQLFFFDAEKIRSLAEDETSSKALSVAIKALLGLDIVERLIADSTVLQGRLTKKGGTPEQRQEVEKAEQELTALEGRIRELGTERASLENPLLRAKADLKKVEEQFAAAGGKHWEVHEDRRSRKTALSSVATALDEQLVALASGELPLALVTDLLESIAAKDSHEREAQEARIIQGLLQKRDKRLLEVLRTARAPAKLVERIATHLEADRESRVAANGVAVPFGLSETDRSLLQHLREQKLPALCADARKLLKKRAKVEKERDQVERDLAATPAEGRIGQVVDRLKAATEAATLLEEQARRLDEAIESAKASYEDSKRVYARKWEGLASKDFEQEDARRMIDLAGRTRETMQEFLKRVTARKIDRLSALITESFRFLHRKQDFVERIHIDPVTFAITLCDDSGAGIAKERLSEGEKQIFAISVLWGLARASARPLPAVIDTPMARLDVAHRNHLVERYFPNASHQVVIFSTDTEVDRKYYELLQPFIARAYHLNYDQKRKVTVGEEGYFWKE